MTNETTTTDEVAPDPALAALLERAGAITAHVTDADMEDDYLHDVRDSLHQALTCGNDIRAVAESSDEVNVATLMLDIAEAMLEPGEMLSGCALGNALSRIEEARQDHRAGPADLGTAIDLAAAFSIKASVDEKVWRFVFESADRIVSVMEDGAEPERAEEGQEGPRREMVIGIIATAEMLAAGRDLTSSDIYDAAARIYIRRLHRIAEMTPHVQRQVG